MKTRKRFIAALLAAGMVMSLGMTAMAYDNLNKDPNRAPYGWQWEDWDSNGIYECYYYDTTTGRKYLNTTTPDGYQLDKNGAWVVNGVVQTKTVEKQQIAIDYAAYDSAHPLANVVDAWNLKLPKNYFGDTVVVNDNVQAMLTNQMSQYYMPPVGYSTDSAGNQLYTTQEAVDRAVKEEQVLYDWFCNWLNSMDFQHMSEMDRAKAIQNVLIQGVNITGKDSDSRNAYCSVLIDKQGMCAEYAVTAISLAKALGLKSAVSGTGNHAVYYIQIDGVGYFGQNNVLNLNVPTPDFVAFD